jgi:hypothetical protein
VPIRFFWIDCGDNTVSNAAGDKLYISDKVYDYVLYGDPFNSDPVNDGFVGFPTYQGAQEYCLDGFGDKPPPERAVDFQNGGIDIICADSIDARGDINLNGLAYEIADAVMFTNYFIDGFSAFTYIDGSTAASDTNADGVPLTVADLVYLIRVVVGDAMPYPKISPMQSSYSFEAGVLNVSAEMGAALVVLEGEANVELLAENMDMRYGFNGSETRVLVYSTQANQTFVDNFLRTDAQVLSVEFATYEGQPVVASEVPVSFELKQNYPNPFNPTTNIDLSIPGGGEWKLVIYNVTGQVVETFSGVSETGIESVEWDASGLASGIYFYKVIAGDYTATKKAVLLK